jgi:hypothetical protein
VTRENLLHDIRKFLDCYDGLDPTKRGPCGATEKGVNMHWATSMKVQKFRTRQNVPGEQERRYRSF